MGEYIRERLGPAGFPADVTPDSLRVWLEQRVQTGEARELAESTIAGVPAFTLTEVYDSGCERVVYWRPQALHRLVRLATGCESPHLAEFEYIAATLR